MTKSTKYTQASRNQPCTFQIPGVCNGDWSTTVFAHIRDENKGMGNKASDISGADACFSCHAAFDGQSGEPLSKVDWLFYALRGIQRTIANRIARGIMIVPINAKKRPAANSKAKIKNPSRPIQSQGFQKPKSNTKYLD